MWILSPIPWIYSTVVFVILSMMLALILILFKLFTHGFDELTAKFSGKPICMFFEDTRYVTWKPIKPEAGLIQDKHYGSFIINEAGSYIDRNTKNIYLPFDSSFGAGASMKAFKITDDLWKVFQDEGKMNMIRVALMKGDLDHTELEGIRESINFSHLRSLSNTILPHNITGKIEKALAQRLQGLNQINYMMVAGMFVAILGAIIMGAVLLKMYG